MAITRPSEWLDISPNIRKVVIKDFPLLPVFRLLGLGQTDRTHELGKDCVTRNFRRKPQMVSSWFEFMGTQNASDRFGRNATNNPFGLKMTGQFSTIPV
jgi:hypothetical protein